MNSERSLSAIHTNVMYDYLKIAVYWLYPRYRGPRYVLADCCSFISELVRNFHSRELPSRELPLSCLDCREGRQ